MWRALTRPPWRTIAGSAAVFLLGFSAYLFWTPGLDVRDGRDDRARNGMWISHGWLGADRWFVKNEKTNEIPRYRNPDSLLSLRRRLQINHILYVFPHLCPADIDGHLPPIDDEQAERLLDALVDVRVLPWVGGPNGGNVRLESASWRKTFEADVSTLLEAHPRFAGVHLNVEPLPTGDKRFIEFLDELKTAIPAGKKLSVAGYPPPTRWHPYPDVHWDESFFREVAKHCDQLAVMMYDAGQRIPKCYQKLMADWTGEVLQWSGKTEVLLGVPTYDDPGMEYHRANVENLKNALLGVHRGLSHVNSTNNYAGVAIYCDWETDAGEWAYFQQHFLRK